MVLERGVFSDRFSIERLSYEQGKRRIAKQQRCQLPILRDQHKLLNDDFFDGDDCFCGLLAPVSSWLTANDLTE